jgi:putative peptidoglycan lipid II flippase
MFPAIIVILFANIVLLIEKSVATNYSEGSVTQLNLAFRLVSIFSAVLILPLSTVLLPKLSKNYGSNNHDRLYELIKKGLQYAVLAIFPFLAGIILNDSLVSKVFFGILHLPAEAMQHIARYLTIYSFAIAFSFINMVLQEVFYSIQKAKYLIVANVLGTAIYLGIIFAFSVHLGVRVLPVAYIAYLMVTTVFPLLVLERKIFRSESTVLNWGFLAGILLFSVLLFWLKNFLCSGGYKMLTGVFLTLGLFAGYFWIFRERLKRLLSFALREKPL